MKRLIAGVLALVAALVVAAPAPAFTRSDQMLTMGDGVPLATTLYSPDGAAPQGGWPAVLLLHGLGGNRLSMNQMAVQFFAPYGYAVLTVDARGHGQSGGRTTLAGAREAADYAAAAYAVPGAVADGPGWVLVVFAASCAVPALLWMIVAWPARGVRPADDRSCRPQAQGKNGRRG